MTEERTFFLKLSLIKYPLCLTVSAPPFPPLFSLSQWLKELQNFGP